MILTLSLIPVLLCICFLIISFANYSFVSLSAKNICRKYLLTGQDKIRLEMVKLIKLNKKVKSLKRQYKLFKICSLAATILPPAKLVCEAGVKATRIRQELLAMEQIAHVLLAKKYGVEYFYKLKSELNKLGGNVSSSVGLFPFSLNKTPKGSKYPEYQSEINFKQNQAVTAHWSISSFNNFSFNAFLNNKNLATVSGFCGATIDNKVGKKWIAELIKKGRL